MKKIKVPELELKILKILWDLKEPSLIQDVIEKWSSEPAPGYTTILKKLQVMEVKEYVSHEKRGRAYGYYPLIKKSDVSFTKFNGILTDLFGGDKIEMATAFVKDTGLTKDDINSLMLLLDEVKDDE